MVFDIEMYEMQSKRINAVVKLGAQQFYSKHFNEPNSAKQEAFGPRVLRAWCYLHNWPYWPYTTMPLDTCKCLKDDEYKWLSGHTKKGQHIYLRKQHVVPPWKHMFEKLHGAQKMKKSITRCIVIELQWNHIIFCTHRYALVGPWHSTDMALLVGPERYK